MIALVFSALLAAFLLIPFSLFRFVFGLFVPLRIIQDKKTDDFFRVALTLFFIFIVALGAVWHAPLVRSHPFYFADAPELRKSDYTLVLSGFYSEPIFKDTQQKFWDALWRTLWRQGRLLFWYYILVALIAFFFGLGSKYYGYLRRFWLYSWFADLYLLPHISQWYVLLTPFAFADKRTIVRADVLMTDDTLYQGRVVDHFLDKDGNLSGLFLGGPKRFDRQLYLREKERWGTTRSLATFWREIPSRKLYLFADKIVNLNVNHEPPSTSLEAINRFLTKLRTPPFSVSISSRSTVTITSVKDVETNRTEGMQLLVYRDGETWIGKLKEPSALQADLERAGIFESAEKVVNEARVLGQVQKKDVLISDEQLAALGLRKKAA